MPWTLRRMIQELQEIAKCTPALLDEPVEIQDGNGQSLNSMNIFSIATGNIGVDGEEWSQDGVILQTRGALETWNRDDEPCEYCCDLICTEQNPLCLAAVAEGCCSIKGLEFKVQQRKESNHGSVS